MNAYIYGGISRISSNQTFAQYKQAELNQDQRAVNKDGDLLDYETLELRVHPPNIQVKVEDNETLITLDSANRPGTLIEVRILLLIMLKCRWLVFWGFSPRSCWVRAVAGCLLPFSQPKSISKPVHVLLPAFITTRTCCKRIRHGPV
jgi:hypothetical protein